MISSRNRRRPTASWNCSDTSHRECGWLEGPDKKGPDNYRLADGSLDVAGVRNDFADGYTIVMDGIEQYVRTIGTLARSLEVELNFPTQVNAYITPPHSSGLVPHYDDHDVLVLQIQGSKILASVCRRRPAGPSRSNATPKKPSRSKVCRRQRNCCWKPATCCTSPAAACTLPQTHAEPSVHLTVGIHAPTVLMLAIGALHSQSFRDDRLNARLPAAASR